MLPVELNTAAGPSGSLPLRSPSAKMRPATLGSGTPRSPAYFFFFAFLAVFFAAFLFLAITYSFGLWLEAYMEEGAVCPIGTALAK